MRRVALTLFVLAYLLVATSATAATVREPFGAIGSLDSTVSANNFPGANAVSGQPDSGQVITLSTQFGAERIQWRATDLSLQAEATSIAGWNFYDVTALGGDRAAVLEHNDAVTEFRVVAYAGGTRGDVIASYPSSFISLVRARAGDLYLLHNESGIDANGYFVTTYRVEHLDADGTLVSSFAVPPAGSVLDMEVTSSGDVLLLHAPTPSSYREVLRFSAEGLLLGTIEGNFVGDAFALNADDRIYIQAYNALRPSFNANEGTVYGLDGVKRESYELANRQIDPTMSWSQEALYTGAPTARYVKKWGRIAFTSAPADGDAGAVQIAWSIQETLPIGSTVSCQFGTMTSPITQVDCSAAQRTQSGTYTATVSDPETYRFFVSLGDSSYRTTSSAEWTVSAVSAPPDVTVTNAPSGTVYRPEATVEFTLAGGAADTVRCTLDGTTPSDCTSPVDYSGLAPGDHQFVVEACNADGCDSDSRSWTQEGAPTVTLTKTPTDPSFEMAGAFEWTTTGTLETTECTLDGSAPTACSSPRTYSVTPGPHSFAVIVCNPAGCDSASYAWTVLAPPPPPPPPLLKPDVTITEAPPATTQNTTDEVKFSLAGGVAMTVSCTLDGGAATPCTSPYRMTGLTPGTHSFVVEACNGAGCDSDSVSWRVVVRPAVTITSAPPTNAPVLPGDHTVAFDVTGGTPDYVRCTLTVLYINGSSSQRTEPCSSTKTYRGYDGHDYRFEVEACNDAGCGSDSTTWTVREPTTPTEECLRPVRASVSSTDVSPGDRLEIRGRDFMGGTRAFIGNVELPIEGRTGSTLMVVVIPQEASTGALRLRCDDLQDSDPPVVIIIRKVHLPPVAQGVAEKLKPRQYTLDGSMSYDQNEGGRIVSYRWTLKGKTISRKAAFTRSFEPGQHRLRLTVKNAYGLKDSTLVTVKPKLEVTRLTLPNVLFCFDCDALSRQANRIVAKARKYARGAHRVHIAGHTDAVGTDAYNQALSRRRVASVKSALLTGLRPRPKRVTTRGHGEGRPVSSNKSATGRARNRRVELTFWR